MCLIRVPNSHDLVLEFDSEPSRKKFLVRLETFVTSQERNLEMVPSFKAPMLANAETKERRRKKLERFFREAYVLTFGMQ